MLFCEDCRKKKRWPREVQWIPKELELYGLCEICHEREAVHNMPPALLPNCNNVETATLKPTEEAKG